MYVHVHVYMYMSSVCMCVCVCVCVCVYDLIGAPADYVIPLFVLIFNECVFCVNIWYISYYYAIWR